MTNQKPHIVLIEDNDDDVFLVMETLRIHDLACELTRMDDGQAAVGALGPGSKLPPPDLILLDLNLPRRDGREVLRAVRQNPLLDGTPVAVLTSSLASRDREESIELGADRYVTKPTDWQSFHEAVSATIAELLSYRRGKGGVD